MGVVGLSLQYRRWSFTLHNHIPQVVELQHQAGGTQPPGSEKSTPPPRSPLPASVKTSGQPKRTPRWPTIIETQGSVGDAERVSQQNACSQGDGIRGYATRDRCYTLRETGNRVRDTRHGILSTGHAVRDTEYGTRGTGYQVRCTLHGIPDAGHAARDTRHGTRGTGYRMRDTRYETPDAGRHGIPNTGHTRHGISDAGHEIRDTGGHRIRPPKITTPDKKYRRAFTSTAHVIRMYQVYIYLVASKRHQL